MQKTIDREKVNGIVTIIVANSDGERADIGLHTYNVDLENARNVLKAAVEMVDERIGKGEREALRDERSGEAER